MILYAGFIRFVISCFIIVLCKGSNFLDATQDQTTARANTLLDDADDIQRQLDNEARDRIKFGRPKTIWVFHLPTQFPDISAAVKNVTRSLRDTTFQKHRFKKKFRLKHFTNLSVSVEATKDWDYKDQNKWKETYPECGRRSQSPVDLSYNGLIKARGARKLLHVNYDVTPHWLKLSNDGRQVVLTGDWPKDKWPYIYGGAAHSRRYLFHSLTLHWPSEHTVAGLMYPMETQVLHVSAEYRTMQKALEASESDPLAFLAVSTLYKIGRCGEIWPGEHDTVAGLMYPMETQVLHVSAEYRTMQKALEASESDPLAFLAVSTLYKYGNSTDEGLCDIIKVAAENIGTDAEMPARPLRHFSPPLPEYACYQGSLTAPPCSEAVLWLIRGRTLQITRETLEMAESLLKGADDQPVHSSRSVQPMNDRKAFYFKNGFNSRQQPKSLSYA